MNHKKRKNLIISLLRDDLINQKLILGLQKLGIDAGMYCLYLSDTVFKLMGFKKDEVNSELYDLYATLSYKVEMIDFSNSYEPLDELALELYVGLMKFKEEMS